MCWMNWKSYAKLHCMLITYIGPKSTVDYVNSIAHMWGFKGAVRATVKKHHWDSQVIVWWYTKNSQYSNAFSLTLEIFFYEYLMMASVYQNEFFSHALYKQSQRRRIMQFIRKSHSNGIFHTYLDLWLGGNDVWSHLRLFKIDVLLRRHAHNAVQSYYLFFR